jgi:hypothetical protein
MSNDLLLDYTALDARYTHGKFRFITGDNSASPRVINDPADTRIDDIRAYQDVDPVLFSYLNGGDPRALLCNIDTPMTGTPPYTSTGKYTVCVPAIPSGSSAYTWSYPGTAAVPLAKDIALKDGGGNDVAGNPHGFVQIGNFLYIVDYDSANIYILDIAVFEAVAVGGTYTPRITSAASLLPSTAGIYNHGEALIYLTTSGEDPVVYLYALFSSATVNNYGYPDVYSTSTIVRYEVDTDTGALSNPVSVEVGKSATALIPATVSGTPYIFVPAVGGVMQYGTTIGPDSMLSVVDAFTNFAASSTAPIALTGDASSSTSASSTYDIYGIASSADGANVYLLTVTFDEYYVPFWRLYKTDAAYLQGLSKTTPAGTALSQATGLSAAESGHGGGNYWEVLYENSAGRLWFLKGSPIRVSDGANYATVLKTVDYSGTLYDSTFNVNSADLIGETIYQGASVNTRLGTTRTKAKAVQAAAAAVEEEK